MTDWIQKEEEYRMTVTEQTCQHQEAVPFAGPIHMTKKNTVLHVNNYARLGGIETTVIDFAKAFPQLFHILLTIYPDGEDLNFIQHLRNQHVQYMNAGGMLTQKIVREIDPFTIILHNTNGRSIEGEYPYEWLRQYRVMGAHHMVTFPLVPADYDWFVSDWVRSKYKNCENRLKGKAVTMPPCVDVAPYISIQRPARRPVVGRAQSGTWVSRGKVPASFYDLLRRLKGCDYSLVGTAPSGDDRFQVRPPVPGGMVKILEGMDIFVIWGDTTESWSKVVTEANLSGIPVVARDHKDGLSEQLRASGGGVLVQSEADFVDKVQWLIDQPETRNVMGELGRRWCMRNASLDRLRKQFLDLFLEWSVT